MTTAPVLFVTNQVPPDRVGAFAALAERVPLELVAFGGRSAHATADTGAGTRIRERDVARIVTGGSWSAVVCGTAGRVALPSAYLGARRAGLPFVLWASLWAHPRTPAHLLSYAAMRRIYSGADAVVTYGEHVSRYVRERGARRVHVAPQAVDARFWSTPGTVDAALAKQPFVALFAARDVPEKGLGVLRAAWAEAGVEGELVVAGGDQTPEQLRNLYAAADVLVMPSLHTRTFREPWGLVANEAMHQRTAIIASDQVGAAAGGLVRHERNGLIVPAGDVAGLAAALRRAAGDPPARARWAAQGAEDVAAYTYDAWAGGFTAALADVGAC
ncbi:MAG TPA: glycosyltransferase family 4 protein [Solirubrobacteraceae bacterium]|nr:glycosyltransferase family 4 protein [Solirubrobacteraceae bacterium]